MLISIIDLGTNTFNLIIADIQPSGSFNIVYRKKLPSKLGKEGICQNLITPQAIERGFQALVEHKKTIDQHGIQKIYAFATSAIRCATNRQVFIDFVKNELNIEVQLISGLQEAELIYHGVRQAYQLEEDVLILDIGGGSNEFIIANKDGILWKDSFPLGIARLLEMFAPSEPITQQEIGSIESYIEDELSPLFDVLADYRITKLVGSSGSFTTLSNMVFLAENELVKVEHNVHNTIDLESYFRLHEYLLTTTLEDRLKMKGVDIMRIEMLVVASVFINYIVKKLGIKTIIQSKYALKEGALWLIAQNRLDEFLCNPNYGD